MARVLSVRPLRLSVRRRVGYVRPLRLGRYGGEGKAKG